MPRGTPTEEPLLALNVRVCEMEADPEAASVFFRGNAAIAVRVSIVSCGSVVSSGQSRTVMSFEDNIDFLISIPVTEQQYADLVLDNGTGDDEGSSKNGERGNHVVVELLSIGQGEGATDLQHAGQTKPIAFLDQLDGFCLPNVEPDHVREYEVKLKTVTQAVLMLKLWTELSPKFEAYEGAIQSIGGADVGDSDGSQPSQQTEGIPQDETGLQLVANQLGIDPVSEPHLLWIAQEALETQLPPFWVRIDVEDGAAMYKNLRSGQESGRLPSLEYFQQLTNKERQRIGNKPNALQERLSAGGSGQSSSSSWDSTWVRVGDRERYFYSFDEQKRVIEKADLPEDARVVEPLPSIVEPYRPNGLAKTGPRPTDPTVKDLTFYTWWKEGTPDGLKRYTTKIVYDLETQNFIVSFEDAHDTVTLSEVEGRHGPLNQWDLHVTGMIDLLGRKVTLQQCDETTLRWIDYRGRRFAKLRAKLKMEVMKFDKKLQHKEYTVPAFRKDGRTDLRSLIHQIEELYRRLAEYRPGLAKKMLSQHDEVLSFSLLASSTK